MASSLQQSWFGNDWRYYTNATPAFQNHPIDANNDALEYIFQAVEAATITRIGVRFAAVTGTTPTYRVSLQGVDTSTATAIPSGTIKGATNNALKTFSPSGLGWSAGTWNWLTLDETYACSRGENLAIVIDYSSGTVDGSNFASFSYNFNGPSNTSLPRAITNAATVRTVQTGGFPIYGYGSAGTAYGRPIQALSSVTLTNASAPREAGMRFTAPAGWGATYTVAGADFYSTPGNSSANATMRLYLGGGASDVTVLQDVATPQGMFSIAASQRNHRLRFDESSLTALNYGDTYRWSMETAGGSYVIRYVEVAAAADWDAFPGGQNICWTQRDSGGNWADTTTRRMFDWMLLIDDITEPTGGGILVHPGMRGGCNG